MASQPRIVAELGRPETPEETAARKAESSRVYRGSQTFRNLIAALVVTVAVVAVVVFAVPRGTPPPADPIDVSARAAALESSRGQTVLAPQVPADWRVNAAGLDGDDVESWQIVYVPRLDAGFLTVAQGFSADAGWPARVLPGSVPDGTIDIDGIAWTRYRIADPAKAGNITDAIGVQAGPDIVLVYGATDDEFIRTAAAGVSDAVRRLQEKST